MSGGYSSYCVVGFDTSSWPPCHPWSAWCYVFTHHPPLNQAEIVSQQTRSLTSLPSPHPPFILPLIDQLYCVFSSFIFIKYYLLHVCVCSLTPLLFFCQHPCRPLRVGIRGEMKRVETKFVCPIIGVWGPMAYPLIPIPLNHLKQGLTIYLFPLCMARPITCSSKLCSML